MSEHSFKISWRPDNIRLIEVGDSSIDTVREWERVALEELATFTEPQKQLYDLRALSGVSIFALRTSVKLNAHPKSKSTFIAVLTQKSLVADMVRTVLAIQPGGNFQLFEDEAKAVEWLHKMVPDK